MGEKGSRDEMRAGMPGAENAPEIARLCYVDDSRTSAYVVRRLLQPYGYRVDHFSSAEPAFVALVQEDYDLLLTDLKVSSTGMDGDDLIRTLRQSGHPKISTMPIIVITGATDAEVLVGVYDAGANQVMKKPVTADELDGHIRRLLFNGRKIEPAFSGARTHKADRRSGDATVVTLPTAHRAHREPERRETRIEPVMPADAAPLDEEGDLPVLNADAPVTPSTEAAAPLAVSTAHEQEATNSSSIEHDVTADIIRDNPEPDTVSSDAVATAQIHETAYTTSAATAQSDSAQSVDSETPISVDSQAENLQIDAEQQSAQTTTETVVEKETQETPVPESTDELAEEAVIIEPDMRESRRGRAAEDAHSNILHDIEQYPLIVNERTGLLGGSNFVGMAHSLVELVGIRSLIMRLLGVGVVLTLLIAGWKMYYDQGVPVETVFVESGEIFQSITVPGRVVSKQRVNVSSARAGRLVEVLAKEGDKVKKGQVLARIDDRELLSRLNRAKAKLSNARADIVIAERTLKRLRKAQAKGAVARRFVEDAEVDLRSARTKAGVAVEEVRSATLEVSNQQIRAAFEGTVTAKFAEIGQWVGPTETLFTLVDESQREIEVRVDAADSVAIDVGQVVAVSSDAFPGLEWQESVTRLGAATNNDRNTNTVKVYISLGNDAPSLRFGQQVDADIRTAWNPNTLKIPFEALISRDGQTMVAVLEGNRVKMKIVETGIEDFAMAEIKQGLNDGEMVILSKGMILHNGDRVHPKRDSE